MCPPKGRENTITSYSITEKNLVGTVEEPVENYDLMTAVMICLGGPANRSEPDVLRLLDVLFSSETGADEKRHILQQDFDIPMTQSLGRTVDVMCNLSKGVWEKGWKEGWNIGWNIGWKKGAEEAMLDSIKTLMETTGWPVEQVMFALGVPEADRSKYLDTFNGQK